jgi:hypothetical protein
MSQAEAYRRDGFVHLPRFVPVPVANALLARMTADFRDAGVEWSQLEKGPPQLARPAPEVYGFRYAPLIAFLWGMTPAVSALLGCELMPTYSYFRLYRRGDICRVHSDRFACEHSMSLTLAYADGLPWALEIGGDAILDPKPSLAEDFGAEPHSAVAMAAGDAVLYQGVHRRHGRTAPNPNLWSAHLFLHWVDAAGPYAGKAFDGRTPPAPSELGLG